MQVTILFLNVCTLFYQTFLFVVGRFIQLHSCFAAIGHGTCSLVLHAQRKTTTHSERASVYALHPLVTVCRVTSLRQTVDLATANATEEDKLRAAMDQASQYYHPSQYVLCTHTHTHTQPLHTLTYCWCLLNPHMPILCLLNMQYVYTHTYIHTDTPTVDVY